MPSIETSSTRVSSTTVSSTDCSRGSCPGAPWCCGWSAVQADRRSLRSRRQGAPPARAVPSVRGASDLGATGMARRCDPPLLHLITSADWDVARPPASLSPHARRRVRAPVHPGAGAAAGGPPLRRPHRRLLLVRRPRPGSMSGSNPACPTTRGDAFPHAYGTVPRLGRAPRCRLRPARTARSRRPDRASDRHLPDRRVRPRPRDGLSACRRRGPSVRLRPPPCMQKGPP